MIPIRQTRSNNCVSACLASVLELQLSEVPDFKPETWDEELYAWLEPRGWSHLNVSFPSNEVSRPFGYSLGVVEAGNGFPEGYKHCVVCLDGKIVWDPFRGEQPGTERSEEYTILYPKSPPNQGWLKQ